MSRRTLVVAATLGVAAVLSILGVYAVFDALASGPGRRAAEVWEIPGDYRGLIVAHFGVTTCPLTPLRERQLIYSIAPDGSFCTSDLLAEGSAVDLYQYVYADGRRVMLRYGDQVAKLLVRGSIDPDRRTDVFVFLGTPEEQRRALANLPK